MMVEQSRFHIALGIFALISVSVALFAPVITFDFIVEYDDQAYIIDNPILEKPSLGGLISVFTSFRNEDYLPVLHTSFFLEACLWGKSPAGFHLMNLLLHVCNGIMIFLLLMVLLERKPIAFLAALIFLTHPVQVESVAWVTERKNVLSLFFMLIAFYFTMVKSREWLAVGSYALSLFSKSIGTVYPVFVLITGPLLRTRIRTPTIVVMFMIALLGAGLTYVSQSQIGAVKSYHGGSIGATLVLMGQSYWGYVFSLMTGRGLSPVHSIPAIDWAMGLGFYGVVLATALFLLLRKEWLLLWAMAAFFLFLLPVSNLIPIAVLRAERYLYIPIVFFFLAVLHLFDRGWRRAFPRRPQIGVWLFGTLLFFGYVPATAQYLPVYRDAQSMWSYVAREPSLEGMAFYNLGVIEERLGRIVNAMAYYERARRANGHCGAVNNLGSIVFDRGFHEKAHHLFLEAEAKCPEHPGVHYNLGLSFLVRNDVKRARSHLEKTIEEGRHHPELVRRARKTLEHIRERPEHPK
jgi:hypothetical protein